MAIMTNSNKYRCRYSARHHCYCTSHDS